MQLEADSPALSNSQASDEFAFSAHSRLLGVKVTRRINRGHLNEEQVMHLVLRRYGSTTDFSQVVSSYAAISRATGVPLATLYVAIRKFHKNGDGFRKRGPRRWFRLSPEMERWLCSHECLFEWRCLPLKRRVFLLKQQYDVDLLPGMLAQVYKRNGVRFTKAKPAARMTKPQEAKLAVEREQFARKLLTLPVHQLVYADETTFDVWTPPGRVWQGKDKHVVIPLNRTHLKNITVYGAVGICLREPVYFIGDSTNAVQFVEFVQVVR